MIRGTGRLLPEAAIIFAGTFFLALAMSVPSSGEEAGLSVLNQSATAWPRAASNP